jgi:hypothetical protein
VPISWRFGRVWRVGCLLSATGAFRDRELLTLASGMIRYATGGCSLVDRELFGGHLGGFQAGICIASGVT